MNGDGDHVVFQVVEVIPGTQATPEVVDYLAQSNRQSLYGGFVGAIREDAGLTINRQVFDEFLASGTVQ